MYFKGNDVCIHKKKPDRVQYYKSHSKDTWSTDKEREMRDAAGDKCPVNGPKLMVDKKTRNNNTKVKG